MQISEQELEQVMQQVLLDKLRREWGDLADCSLEPLPSSKRHQKQMADMLADPIRWARKRTRPVWKTALQKVAVFLLICSLALGALLAVSPSARAMVKRWFVEQEDTHTTYHYSGEFSDEELPTFVLTKLPDGYTLVHIVRFPGFVNYTYENDEGHRLYFDYAYMHEGTAVTFSTENLTVYETTYNGCPATFLFSENASESNALTWIDETLNFHFTIDGFFSWEELVALADSIRQADSVED